MLLKLLELNTLKHSMHIDGSAEIELHWARQSSFMLNYCPHCLNDGIYIARPIKDHDSSERQKPVFIICICPTCRN